MAARFQKMLESATEQTLVDPNWESILECVDMIRGGEVPQKEALRAIQKRYHSSNPHTAHHALLVLEAWVKNCGKKFITELATRESMEDLKNFVISNPPEKIRTKILELIQCWATAFKGIPEYRIVGDTHYLLKMNGFEFPPIDEQAKAMFLAESAPDWAEGDNCYRCRVEFGVFTRKHHCRACGQIFCDRCSNKQMLLPQFGIEKKVRVCEACFDKNAQSMPKGQPKAEDKNAEEAANREKTLKEAQAKEQEEFELALAISQSEAEAKEQERLRRVYQQYNGNGAENNNYTGNGGETPSAGYDKLEPVCAVPAMTNLREELALSRMGDDVQEMPFDSVLSKYLDRDYWERKRRETEEQMRATAPPASEISISASSSVSQKQPQQNGTTGNNKNGGTVIGRSSNDVPDYGPNDVLDFSQLEDLEQPPLSILTQQQQPVEEISRNFAKMNMLGMMGDGKGGSGMDGEEQVAETSQFCRLLKERVDTMNNRMRSNQLRGRSIVNDSAIHSLFSQLTEMHGTVLQRMTKLEEQREHFERLQDHLAHIQESRQAVNALREENDRQRQERLREEQSRRQVQLRQKLELMRHKKHEMLMTERFAAIQRFQEQERQIRQQRGGQQQSPQTVGGGLSATASMPAMPLGGVQTPMTHPAPTPTMQQQQYVPNKQQQPQQPMPPQQQMPPQTAMHPQQQQQMPVYSMPPTSQYPMPHNSMAAYQQTGIPMMPSAYSMPPTAIQQHHPPYVSSPQMMYAAAAAPYPHHPGMPMPTSQQHTMMQQGPPPLFHPHHQMSPYPPQYMPQPSAHQQQMPQPMTAQPQQRAEQQQEAPKSGPTEVPEDLLISFD